MFLIISSSSNSNKCRHILFSDRSASVYILFNWFTCVNWYIVEITSMLFILLISKNLYCWLHVCLMNIQISYFITYFIWLTKIPSKKFIAYLDWSSAFFPTLLLVIISIKFTLLHFRFGKLFWALSSEFNLIIIFFLDITDDCSTSNKSWSSKFIYFDAFGKILKWSWIVRIIYSAVFNFLVIINISKTLWLI
jgi:hypothetical protein